MNIQLKHSGISLVIFLATWIVLLASSVQSTAALTTERKLASKLVHPLPDFHFIWPVDKDTIADDVTLAVYVPTFWHEQKGKFQPTVEWSYDGHHWQAMTFKEDGRFVAQWHTASLANGVYKLQARYHFNLNQDSGQETWRVTDVTVQVANEPSLNDGEIICACASLPGRPTAWV